MGFLYKQHFANYVNTIKKMINHYLIAVDVVFVVVLETFDKKKSCAHKLLHRPGWHYTLLTIYASHKLFCILLVCDAGTYYNRTENND